jgi:hypothetical protein
MFCSSLFLKIKKGLDIFLKGSIIGCYLKNNIQLSRRLLMKCLKLSFLKIDGFI